MSTNKSYKIGQTVVYPAHGVGKITSFGEQEVAGFKLDMITITCGNATISLPRAKAEKNGLRPVSGDALITKAFETLRDSPRQQQGIWARRAKGLEERLNSGDIIMLSRLLRDLAPRGRSEKGFSYTERLYFEKALDWVSLEIASSKKKPQAQIKAEMEKALAEQKPPIYVPMH